MTKFQKNLIDNFNNAPFHSIYDAYDRPSNAKVSAYNRLFDMAMNEYNAFSTCVPTRNTFAFTFAFLYTDKVTGEIRLQYHTPSHVYDFSI